MRVLAFFFLVLFAYACSETHTHTVYEVELPDAPSDTLLPDSFAVRILAVTDVSITLAWDAQEALLYDVAVNDSVLAYDLDASTYKITSLPSDSNFIVSVLAYNRQRNATNVEVCARTMKPYFAGAISYDLPFESYYFEKINRAADGGLLIYGVDRSEGTVPFFLKTNDDFSLDYVKRFELAGVGVDVVAGMSGCAYALTTNSLYKLDPQGAVIWSFAIPLDGEFNEFKCLTVSGEDDVFVVCTNALDLSITKLASNGVVEWSLVEPVGTCYAPSDIYYTAQGELMLAGKTPYATSNYYGGSTTVHPLCLSWFDGAGALIRTSTYCNVYNGSDGSAKILALSPNNYWIHTTTSGYMPPNRYWKMQPRIVNVSLAGDSIWDNYYDSFGAYAVSITGSYLDDDKLMLMLQNDDDIMYLLALDFDGNVISKEAFPDFPRCRFLAYTADGDFYLVSSAGQLLFYNHDGYH